MTSAQREKRSRLYRQLLLRSEFRDMAESSIRKFVTDRCEVILGDYLYGRVDLDETILKIIDRRKALVGSRPKVSEKAVNPGPPPQDDPVQITVQVKKLRGKPLNFVKVLRALTTMQVEIVECDPLDGKVIHLSRKNIAP